jgi:hypothetical protein
MGMRRAAQNHIAKTGSAVDLDSTKSTADGRRECTNLNDVRSQVERATAAYPSRDDILLPSLMFDSRSPAVAIKSESAS